METLKLRNGAEEAKSLVATTYMILTDLMESDPILFYELVMKARNREYRCFGNTGETLQGRNLLERDGRMHDSMRNIIVSAVEGESLDMVLRSPVV